MPKFFKFNISLKFIIYISLLYVFTSIIFSLFFINSEINIVKKELYARAESLVKNLAYNSELGVIANDKEQLDNLINGLFPEKTKQQDKAEDIAKITYAAIYDDQGKLLSEIGKSIAEASIDVVDATLILKRYMFRGMKNGKETSQIFTFPIITEVIPTISGPEGVGFTQQKDLPKKTIGIARLDISLENLYDNILSIKREVSIITLLVLLISIVLTVIIVGVNIGPLRYLVEGTNRVSKGDLTYQVKVKSNDEIGELANSFNEMTKNLKIAYGRLEARSQELEKINKELKDIQYKLVQSSKMAAIGQLGAGVAHELNNPLGGILGYAQYTLHKIRRQNFSPEDFKSCQGYIECIEKEGLRCKTIVENLLKFSRGPKREFEKIDFNRVIKETMPLTGHELKTHKIRIIENYDNNLAFINGNFNKLQQVIVNLMLNAKQAMPEGGELKITTDNVKDQIGNITHARVEVADTGCGIKEENLNHLFEPFFTTKQESKGTGLGLAVSYDIIQEHAGDIDVKTKVGEGTTFTIKIPVLKEEQEKKI